MQPRDVVERYLAEVLNGEGQARPEELISSQTLRQRTTGFRRAFPDLQVTTHTLLVDGDLVAAHFSGRGTHKGLFQGVPATGRGWQADCVAVFRIQDGRIQRHGCIGTCWRSWSSSGPSSASERSARKRRDRSEMDVKRLAEAGAKLPTVSTPLVGIGQWDPDERLPDVALDAVLDGIRRAAETLFSQSVRSADNEQLRED